MYHCIVSETCSWQGSCYEVNIFDGMIVGAFLYEHSSRLVVTNCVGQMVSMGANVFCVITECCMLSNSLAHTRWALRKVVATVYAVC